MDTGNSVKALARLAQPSAQDMQVLSRNPRANSRLSHLLRSPFHRIAGLMIGLALCGALVIVLY